jgi:hypothetical protein
MIEINSRLAREIGRALQSRAPGPHVADSVHRALAEVLIAQSEREEKPKDAIMRREVLSRMLQRGDDRELIDVTVKDGVASLRGVLSSERERDRLRAEIGEIAGITRVEDHTIRIDAASGSVFPSPEDSAPSC